MAESSSHKTNRENVIENKINFNKFDITLLYIIIIDKIISLKNLILRNKEKVLFFQRDVQENEFPCLENGLFKIKNASIMILIIKKNKIINNKRKENKIKKERII